ncbi:MAG TPA: radical SAM protein [Spirochaetia bacterium]|nr:radical SAM protein [Spirochaetia bacterium]
MLWEQGPIRPPSEAGSLLLRVTRNCPWNRCAFCATYKGERFFRREQAEILAEIRAMRQAADKIEELAGGQITDALIQELYHTPGYGAQYFYLANWLKNGGRHVFLQDADSLVLRTGELVTVLRAVKETFPSVERITSYARAGTLARRKPADLADLAGAGLSRLHVGLESGSDEVLRYVQKGVTAAEEILGGQMVVAAGISLCFYVLIGLGGRNFQAEHPRATAAVINAVRPAFVRLRSLSVQPGTPLHESMMAGDFVPLSEDEQVEEIKTLLEGLDPYNGHLVSDHILNLLGEVEGLLSRDKERMLDMCRRYLALPSSERLLYRLGRRLGDFNSLSDLSGPRRAQMEERLQLLQSHGGVEETITRLKRRFV